MSVELFNALNLPISKRKKQDTLREVRRALQKRGKLSFRLMKTALTEMIEVLVVCSL